MSTMINSAAMSERLRTVWAAGDYAAVADKLVLEVGRTAVEAAAITPSEQVLDVACGTGSASIPAATTGARVVALDIVPRLLDAGRAWAATAGVDVEWVEGDAGDLPFAAERFDVVLSTLGVQFAPFHEETASELARVCRPGGRIVLANWTPQGYIGRFFRTLSPYMPAPPAGVSAPPLWGDPDHVTRLFEGMGVTLSFARTTVEFREASAAAFIDFMATCYGPLVKAREALTADGRWDDLRTDLIALSDEMDTSTDGTWATESEYIVITGVKDGVS